jgi:hypothetical protein
MEHHHHHFLFLLGITTIEIGSLGNMNQHSEVQVRRYSFSLLAPAETTE